MNVSVRFGLLFGVILVSLAFANVEVGGSLPNPTLPALDGTEHTLIAAGRASVFVFFNPNQDHSLEVLRELAEIRTELGDRPVHWTGVVSDRFDGDAVTSALARTGLDLPCVIDESDTLYGTLGVRLYPTVGIAGSDGALAAYLPYARVNYTAMVEAHVLHALGEFTDDQLAAVMAPSRVSTGGDAAAAARNLRMARMLADAGKAEKALEKARAAVDLDPDSAGAHALVGEILVTLGDCGAAQESLGRALELDSGLTAASEALEDCAER